MTFRRAYTTFSRLRPKRLALVSTGAFAGAFAVSVDLPDLPDRSSLSHASTLTLLRSYFVWSLLSVDTLVDASPAILDKLLHSSIPGVTTLTEGFIRRTFFPQFIPGEDALQCVPTMERLRRRNFGTALNYSAEADTQENNPLDPHEARFREVETAIDAQGAFEQRMAAEGWAKGSSAFALKVVG